MIFSEPMPRQHVSFSDDVSVGAGTEAGIHPNWHAFGMLVAWSGANIVALLCYVLEFAHSLDASKFALIATWLLWLAYLAVHARATLLGSNPWNLLHTVSLIAVWGFTAPLLLWGMNRDLQMMRGYPAVEATIVSCVNIFISCLPMGGVVAQHALFISMASLELLARSPPTDIGTTARYLMVASLNFVLGTSACCMLCLAHNRRTTMPAPSAAAGAPAQGHVYTPDSADTGQDAYTQSIVASEEEAKGTAGQGQSSMSTPFGGLAFSAFQPSFNLKPTAQPAPSGYTPLPTSLGYNASLHAWVQKAEFLLLAAVPQEEAKLLAGMLSAVFVGTRFLTSVANYAAPGIVAMSPTMDMLAIVLGMMMGGSPDMQGWAAAQLRAYRLHMQHRDAFDLSVIPVRMSVRGLLRNIMPAHVADALEAYEAERERAYPAVAFGEPLGASKGQSSTCSRSASYSACVGVSRGQSSSCSRRASYTALVGSSQGQSSTCSRSASYTACGGLLKTWPGQGQLCEGPAHSLSGSVRSCFPSILQGTYARFTSHPPASSLHVLETNTLVDSGKKLSLERQRSGRRSFSERHEQVTVLFADIVDFTTLSDQLHPSEVMNLLGDLYKEYDERAVELGLYTVDTIGDCYMCAANLVKPLPDHVHVMVGFARSVIKIANATFTPLGTTLSVRVGIHTGPLMSGVIGVHRLKFTLLGDTVNVASRMETTAITNTLQISEHAYKQLRHEQPAVLFEAAEEQSLDGGGCSASPDVHGQEQGLCSMVRGNSAPPCLLASMQEERGAALTELECFVGSSTRGHGSKSLDGQERVRQQQQGQLQQGHEEKQQLQEQQQKGFLNQPEAQSKRGRIKLREPRSLGEKCYSLSQGAVTSFCTAAPAEQSSHTQQPGGLDHGPAHPKSCWLERKLNVKGKGIMKAYTYTGP